MKLGCSTDLKINFLQPLKSLLNGPTNKYLKTKNVTIRTNRTTNTMLYLKLILFHDVNISLSYKENFTSDPHHIHPINLGLVRKIYVGFHIYKSRIHNEPKPRLSRRF